eukprot:m.56246 g.56246  ORF g.56246 m.56246 type:complete len:420 (-) comp6991_c0_seq2:149-1408(-)
MARRVVVTGIGAVTSLGPSAAVSWQRLLAGSSGAAPLFAPDEHTAIPARVGARVPLGSNKDQLDIEAVMKAHGKRKLPLNTVFSLAAAAEAVADAGLEIPPDACDRYGVAVGTGMSGVGELTEAFATFESRGYRRVSPYMVPNCLSNISAGIIAMHHNMQGPNHSVSTACATGAHSIGDAFRFIKYGDADAMVCGGSDACIIPIVVAGFARMQALSTKFNDEPARASRPFDDARDGFVISEGAGILVLEELEHARSRGARIYAEVGGYGLSGDAYHITAPSPDGRAASSAMRRALAEANIAPSDVGHINAHATSTPIGDAVENRAIKDTFGPAAADLAISATKSSTGHALGAAGAIEAIFSILALHYGVCPPTLNLDNLAPEFDLNYVPGAPQEKRLDAVLSNSFGFGGTNSSLCFLRH